MNKQEIVEIVQKELSKEEDTSKAAAERALNAVLEAFRKSIKKDGGCSIVGFGSFSVTKRKARTGVNPQTGEKIKIKASKSIKFKPAAAFKELA
tara:strand:- start:46662 stop:46943 length:282 start_codon:yes stop_codon:yes gene_type:complete